MNWLWAYSQASLLGIVSLPCPADNAAICPWQAISSQWWLTTQPATEVPQTNTPWLRRIMKYPPFRSRSSLGVMSFTP